MKQNLHHRLRILTVLVAYVLMFGGIISIFSIPFAASLALITIGLAIGLLSDRTKISMTRSSWFVLLGGCAIILLCFLILAGEERFRNVRPSPSCFIPAWFTLFHGFRHIRSLVLRYRRHDDAIA